MHKYKPVEFQFDSKIKRSARRLRREHKKLKAIVDMDNLYDIGILNPRGEIELLNTQGGQEGQNGRIIHGQLGNNNSTWQMIEIEPLEIMSC